jgi:hypothetical protein
MQVGNQVANFVVLESSLKSRHRSKSFDNDFANLFVGSGRAARKVLTAEEAHEFWGLLQKIGRGHLMTWSAMHLKESFAPGFIRGVAILRT